MKNENLKSAITCDLDGKVLSFSRGAENIFGYKSKDVVGKMRVSDFSDGEVVLGHVINWLDIAVKEGAWEGDTTFFDKDGNEMPCHIKITPTRDKDGNHTGYLGVTSKLKDKTADDVRLKIGFGTKLFKWMVIMRLPFLSATFVPIFAGAAVASMLGYAVSWPWLGLTLLAGSLLHIGTNTSNDYFDHQSGTDELNYNLSLIHI